MSVYTDVQTWTPNKHINSVTNLYTAVQYLTLNTFDMFQTGYGLGVMNMFKTLTPDFRVYLFGMEKY